ncbi:MAG: T9SS type A sorting domain-containing protein [Ferruginibacter sp.]
MKLTTLLFSFCFIIKITSAQIPSGSVLWLRADQQVFTTTGDKVTSWNDVSGNNFNVSQLATANQPVLVQNVFGNQPSILFDGVHGKYFLNNTSNNIVTAGSPRTVFIVGKMDCAAVANGGGAFPGGGGALFTFRRGTPNFCIEDVTVAPYGNFVYTAGLGTFSNETVNDNFINTSKFTFVNTYISSGTGTHLQVRQNGQPVTVTPQSPCGSFNSCNPAISDNSTTGFTVGDREDLAGQDWQGYISEIIVYPTVLTQADIQQVEQYLSTKYFLSKGAAFNTIASAPKDYSTNINIEGDWKHSYNIKDPAKIILSIKDTCNIYEIRIDSAYNEVTNSLNIGSYDLMRKHYTVKYSNGAVGLKKVRLYFSDADFNALQIATPGLTSLNQLSVLRYNGPTENGIFDTTDATLLEHYLPGQISIGSAFNNNYIELSTYKLGEFWIYPQQTLPVTLLSFNVKKSNNWIQLNWSTAQELNSKVFDIERSNNGILFEKIGSVNASGYSSKNTNYSYLDKYPESNMNFYRLKQIDLDNKFVYSPVRLLKLSAINSLIIFNNPIKRGEILRIGLENAPVLYVELISSSGQLIYKGSKLPNLNSLYIPIPTSISAGQYILKVITKNNTITERIGVL